MKRYTEEQVSTAARTDIAQMLMRHGEKLKKVGSQYQWMRHTSTYIRGNEWYRFSKETGGNAISFMREFYNMDFNEAMEALLGGEKGLSFVPQSNSVKTKPEFVVPDWSSNMHRTFAYLTKTRGIDADVVDSFVSERKIFETAKYHNVAFVGYDENGEIKQAHLRNTSSDKTFFLDVEGSEKKYYFRHIGSGNDLFVFEAAIDMLSYICMNKDNWQESSYVALGGVSSEPLQNVLENNPHIKSIHLCLDNDETGAKTMRRIGSELDERNTEWDIILPNNKDWNEDLLDDGQRMEMKM